jgi:GTPase SAR1 family protein
MRKCSLDDVIPLAEPPDGTPGKKVDDISNQFAKKLTDAGGPFSHPRKTELTLEDIFVYPQVRDLTLQKEDKDRDLWAKPIDSDILLKIDKTRNRILLIGDEKSGKTALCKMLFKHYHNNGYVPVYIDGSKLKHTSVDEFNKLINLSYAEQYSSDTLEAFTRLDHRKKLVILDDFDKQKLDIKYRAVLLSNINKYYTNVILTGGDLFQIGEIVSERQPQIALEDYRQFGILPFGNVMRNRLRGHADASASWHSSLTGQPGHLLCLQNSKFNLTKTDSTLGSSISFSPSSSLQATSLARGESWGLAFSQTALSSLRKMFTVVGPTPLNSSSLFSRSLLSFD